MSKIFVTWTTTGRIVSVSLTVQIYKRVLSMAGTAWKRRRGAHLYNYVHHLPGGSAASTPLTPASPMAGLHTFFSTSSHTAYFADFAVHQLATIGSNGVATY